MVTIHLLNTNRDRLIAGVRNVLEPFTRRKSDSNKTTTIVSLNNAYDMVTNNLYIGSMASY